MAKNFLIFVALFILDNSHAATRFVKATAVGTNNGSSWENAFTDLQTAINGSITGDSVFVAAGIYQPPTNGASFSMKEGVKIFGGFAGTEAHLVERNLAANDTSFLVGRNAAVVRNVNNNLTSAAVLDGFTITGGRTSNFISGGGMYNLSSSPSLSNLLFYKDTCMGEGGAGLANFASSPILTNVIFADNYSYNSGGGMYNNGGSPYLNNVTFVGNKATGGVGSYGGGLRNEGGLPILINVTFSNNTSIGRGGAGMANRNSSCSLTNVVFTNNVSTGSQSRGGGMYNSNCAPILNNVDFLYNVSTYGDGGGAMCNDNASPLLNNVLFLGNISNSGNLGGGGAMFNRLNSSPRLTNVVFSNNKIGAGSLSGGGAMYNQNSSPSLVNVVFSNNSNTLASGGNSMGGAAIFNDNASLLNLTNVTFANNTSSGPGGAIYNRNSSAVVSNSVFWGNVGSSGNDLYNTATSNNTSTSNITYSYTQTNLVGSGNILGLTNPFFDLANPSGADGIWGTIDDGLMLATGSSATNAGNNDSINQTMVTTDITGSARIQNTFVDMGAYEGNPTPLPINITNFTGSVEQNTAKLQWQALLGKKLDYFEIEKSTDGSNYFVAGIVSAQEKMDYYNFHVLQLEQLVYYRLKMIDDNQRSSYSHVIRVTNFSNSNAIFLLFPNPARDEIKIVLQQPMLITIYDALGRNLRTLNGGKGITNIDISKLTPGTYSCVTKEGTAVRFVKL